jgi:hypothetical protein
MHCMFTSNTSTASFSKAFQLVYRHPRVSYTVGTVGRGHGVLVTCLEQCKLMTETLAGQHVCHHALHRHQILHGRPKLMFQSTLMCSNSKMTISHILVTSVDNL